MSRINLVVTLMLLACGCGSAPAPPLRIGISDWPGFEFQYLAQEKGFYTQLGVQVRLVEYSSGAEAQRGFERGQVDGMTCTLIELLQTSERSERPPQVVLIGDFSNGADVILTRTPGLEVGALKGKRVAVEVSSLGTFMLGRALEKKGIDLDAVIMLPTSQSGMEKALLSGSVDAVVTYPPFSLNLLKQRGVREIFNSSEIPGEVVDVLAFNRDVVDSRSRDISRICEAWERALEYARLHSEESYGIMGRRERISAADFRAALTGIKMLDIKQQRELVESGKLPNSPCLNRRVSDWRKKLTAAF